MGNIVIDGAIEWLKDDATGDVVGYKRKDGTEGSVASAHSHAVANVTGLQSALDAKADAAATTAALAGKLGADQAITVAPKAAPMAAADTLLGGNSEDAGRPVSFTLDQIKAAVGPFEAGGVSTLTSNIVLGDSKTQQCFTPSTGPGFCPKWVVAGNAAIGWPFQLVNGGISGNYTAQMLARLPALLAANPGPGWLTIRGMSNDIQSGQLVASGSAVTGIQVTKEMIVANFKSMIALGVEAGKNIALCTEVGSAAPHAVPLNSATTQGALIREAFSYVNAWIRHACAINRYRLIDIETALMDPATGLPIAGALMPDGIHLTYVGSCYEAQAFARAMQPVAPFVDRTTSSRLSPLNLAGPVASAAGSVTADAANDTRIVAPATAAGGIPSGWGLSVLRAGGAASGSKVARGDYTPGMSAQLAFSSTASYGGAGFSVGGDGVNGLGRWDLPRSASTAYAVGRRINANGVCYVCIVPGVTGATDNTATWPTAEGAIVTDGATFLCQRRPVAGEQLMASVDLSFSGLVGNVMPRITLAFQDTTGANTVTFLADIELSGNDGVAGNWLPARARYVSLPLTVPNDNIRYLTLTCALYGENGSSANMIVHRADIWNASRAAAV